MSEHTELLSELRDHERRYQSLIHGPLCGQAADAIDRITAERDGLKKAAENFVAKVDRGEARSTKSYNEFKAALASTEAVASDDRKNT